MGADSAAALKDAVYLKAVGMKLCQYVDMHHPYVVCILFGMPSLKISGFVHALFGHSTSRFHVPTWHQKIGLEMSIFISAESRDPGNHSSFLDFRLFSLLKAQKSNPGYNFRLLASLKGKSQNRFLAFGLLASPCAVSRLHPLVSGSPPFCTCAVLPMTTLLRDREWSQSRRFNWSTTKTLCGPHRQPHGEYAGR